MSGISGQETLKIIIMDMPDTGKSKFIKDVTKVLNTKNANSVLMLGTTGTAPFIISGATAHLVLGLPLNRNFFPLQEILLWKIQQHLQPYKIIVINEMSMMGLKFYNKLIKDSDKLLINWI